MDILLVEKRFWEVDVVRGLAVALMVVYHFVFDLNFFGLAQINFHEGFFLLFQRTIAFLFLTTFGISLVLFKQKNQSITKKSFFMLLLKRSAILAVVALLITLVTSFYPGNGAIVFGVIHFFALATILSFLFLELGVLNLAFSILVFLAFFAVNKIALQTPLLLWLGIPPNGFYTLDYYPLIPWFSLVLLGIFIGTASYEKLQRKFKLDEMPSFFKPLEFLGRHSLAVYLIHQLVLVAFIKIVFNV